MRGDICAVGRHERDNPAADFIEMLENRVYLLARDAIRRIAKWGKRVLDRMRPIGDLRLLDDAGSALERMGQAEQLLDRSRVAPALLQIKNALGELIHEIARLGPEVFVGVLHHALCLKPPYAVG